MSQDETPKSAIELAMERLRKRDAERGAVDRPPTEEQKAAIAEARNVHSAKLAELEILHRSKMSRLFDPADRAQAEDNYRREILRLNEDCERKVSRIRERED
jgi:hypothetical protein